MTHHHDWSLAETPDGPIGHLCVECGERCPTCNTCHRRPTGSSLLICDPCLKHERRVLDDIDRALDHWQPTPATMLRSPRFRQIQVSGTTTTETRDPEGPWTVLDVLAHWARAWSDASGHHGTGGYTAFLKTMHVWAAQNPEQSRWEEYRDAMGKARHTARKVAGLLPARAAAPCVHCGGTVVQDWADHQWNPNRTGLSDTFRCTGCGMTWGDRDRWQGSVHRAVRVVDQAHPDALITLEQARQIWPHIPTATFRSWLKRDRDAADTYAERVAAHEAAIAAGEESEAPWPYTRRLPELGTTHDGDARYRVGDLATYVEWRVDMRRPGPEATRQVKPMAG